MSLADLLKKIKIPHVFPLLTGVIAVVSLLSWVVPSGSFERVEQDVGGFTRELVVPGSYAELPKQITLQGALLTGEVAEGMAAPVSLQGFLSAVPRGLEEAADIIFFIFVMGGVFGILRETGVITATLSWLTTRFRERAWVLVVLLSVLMGVGGSTLGMGEEFLPLVPVFLLLAASLGYDRIWGLSIVILSSGVGFAAATTNPFTVNVAQKIAELPLNSGIGLRIGFFACAMVLMLVHVLRYGRRVKADPSSSLVAGIEGPAVNPDEARLDTPFTARHGLILVSCFALFGGIMVAVQTLHWWLNDMAGGFLAMGLVAAGIGGLGVARATKAFIHGLNEMVVAALVVGFARGIVVVMTDAQILDTVVSACAGVLDDASPHVAVQGMLLFQTTLNFFIPSGSGQAAVTMPLMAPLADLLGVSRQTAVLAFQCGDGFSNMIIPTSGTLMAMLLMAKVPYDRWLRYVGPLFLQLVLLSMVFLVVAVLTGYS